MVKFEHVKADTTAPGFDGYFALLKKDDAAQYPERTDRLALANTEAPNLHTDRVPAK